MYQQQQQQQQYNARGRLINRRYGTTTAFLLRASLGLGPDCVALSMQRVKSQARADLRLPHLFT